MNRLTHYLAPKLLAALKSKRAVKIIIGGRGVGKSTYLGWEMYESFREMPQSLGALTGPTYNMILTKILPSAKKTLISLGLREDTKEQRGHFVIGKKPPHYFKKPYNSPEKWSYVMALWNGAAIEFISMDRPDTARGGSYDYVLNDEAAQGKKQFHDMIMEMTLRGNRQYFGHCHRHGMKVFVTSQAKDRRGYWVEDQKYLRDENGEFKTDADGNVMLDPDVEFQLLTSYDNKAILGEKVLKRWEKLPPYTFNVEILSRRVDKPANTFYPGWENERHTYYQTFEYDYDDQSEFGIYVKRNDLDRQPKLPLMATCDFNASQNTLIVAQEQDQGATIRFLNEFYENGNESLETWLKPFVEYYQHHPKKELYLYGDPGGNKKANLEKASMYDKMVAYLAGHGWKAKIMVKGKPYPGHMMKQKMIHQVLTESTDRFPTVRVHAVRCKWLVISIENAGIKADFTKDKSSETQDIDQRAATHGSDAFDYLLFFRYGEGIGYSTGWNERISA